jgi:cysteine-rich repeat protein
MSGYFAANSKCLSCESITAGCLACSYDDGNNGTLPYNPGLFSCDACDAEYLFIDGWCYTCAVATPYCITCSYTGNFSLPYDPSEMTCTACNSTAGYFLDTNNNNTCMPCSIPNCDVCSGATTCSVCNVGYGVTVMGGCSTCPILNCQTCLNLTYCSACLSGYTEISGLCYGCSSSCACGGYTLPKYPNGDCSTICGDGIIIFPYEGCDDGNTADGDGCSSQCQV